MCFFDKAILDFYILFFFNFFFFFFLKQLSVSGYIRYIELTFSGMEQWNVILKASR